jgi:hypothetical protein
MADRKRRLALGVIALTFLLVAMGRVARAATFTVNTIADTGAGSLRAAITSANLTPTVASNINFNVSVRLRSAVRFPQSPIPRRAA